MSYTTIDGLKLYYEQIGERGKDVILLHGWGQNTTMMAHIANSLALHFKVYNLDFPGFGKSEEPKTVFSVADYSEFIHQFVKQQGIENPIIIAHSFGCRVAIHYAYKYPVHRLVLTGAAGVRDKRGAKYYFRTYTYKVAKQFMKLPVLKGYREKWQNKKGSEDYRNAKGIMRNILVKTVNDDISPLLKDINVETLLVFGENDTATPVAKGQYMEKMMPDATLVIFEGDDHYAYFHQAERFNRVLDAFLRRDYV